MLVINLNKALDMLDTPGPKFRRPRPPPPPPPGTLTAEQEAYASYPFAPKSKDHELLIVRAYAGTGKTRSPVQ